ncbi:MAG: hypothetical protein ACE5OP_10950 [Candidatus Glassbacteria bacterium]
MRNRIIQSAVLKEIRLYGGGTNSIQSLDADGTPIDLSINPNGGDVCSGGNILASEYIQGPMSGHGTAIVIGNDARFVDFSIANTVGLYGMPDSTIASIKLGTAGGIILGIGLYLKPRSIQPM